MESPIYNSSGKNVGIVQLPESVFGVRWSDALMHQVVNAMQMNARPRVAHARTRGEVRGGGRKPWKKKGRGRARHGSIRSPIWRGGGVTHGPRNEKNYTRTIPRNMRAKALFIALSRKFKDGEVVFVDSFGITAPKTVLAKKSLDALAAVSGLEKITSKRRNAALIALSDGTEATKKSFRNIGNVACVPVRDLNPVSVLGSSFIIIENPDAGLAILENRASKKKAGSVTKQK